jgi:hypothetical protein
MRHLVLGVFITDKTFFFGGSDKLAIDIERR